MRPQVAWLAALALALTGPDAARADNSAGQPGQIFSNGAGARGIGMGGSLTAVVRDVSSMYYNPAGLGLLPGREVSLSHESLYGGAAYDYLAYAQNSKKRPGGWGVEFLRLGASGGEGRDEFNGTSGGFGYSETAIGFGMGYRGILFPDMSLGTRFKMLQRSLGSSSDRLIGVDLGMQYGPLLNEKLQLGAVIQNLAALSQGDTSDTLPTSIRAGAGYKVLDPLMITFDMSNDGDFRVGTEYSFGMMAMRMGLQQGALSFGGGFMLRRAFSVDLAIVNQPDLGMSQKVTMGYRFGAGKQEKKTDSFAREYFQNGLGELARRDYTAAAKSLETAFGLDPTLGADENWREKTRRLRALLRSMGLEERPEWQAAFKQEGPQPAAAHDAVSAYLDNDEPKAMLYAHVAKGYAPRDAAYQALLLAMSRLTRMDIRREDVLPPAGFVEKHLQDSVSLVYSRRFEAAINALREALVLDPKNALAWTRLGSAYFASGDKKNAREAWKRALELDPKNDKLRQFMTQQGMD
ncbi:MAG: tetratricopeptide repeat protein [Elusimicrobia bacterium]|nr:tetratricopeptide repeat protein [Elusimicrobiota bacterium]